MALCIPLSHLLPLLLQLLPEIHITLTAWQIYIITSVSSYYISSSIIDIFVLYFSWGTDESVLMERKTMAAYFSRRIKLLYQGLLDRQFVLRLVSRFQNIFLSGHQCASSTDITAIQFRRINSCLTSTAALASWKSGPDVANSSTQASADSSDTWIPMKSSNSDWLESAVAGDENCY